MVCGNIVRLNVSIAAEQSPLVARVIFWAIFCHHRKSGTAMQRASLSTETVIDVFVYFNLCLLGMYLVQLNNIIFLNCM